jgi:hypothetical protein
VPWMFLTWRSTTGKRMLWGRYGGTSAATGYGAVASANAVLTGCRAAGSGMAAQPSIPKLAPPAQWDARKPRRPPSAKAPAGH